MSESAVIQSQDSAEFGDGFIGGPSRSMRNLEGLAAEIAHTNIPILIVGESGTGKQVLARRIHKGSPRKAHPMVRITCANITDQTIRAELHIGERRDRKPLEGSVLFDEIAELDRTCQRTLLHALPDEDNASSRDSLAARVISTSSQNLEDEIRAGRFRDDLYYRISGVSLRIPPLRERREDIPVLVDYFLGKHSTRLGRPRPSLSNATMQKLADHDWPGNIRQLENAVLKIVAVADEEIALADFVVSGGAIAGRVLQVQRDGHSLKAASRAASREAERELILKALARTQWNRKKAAKELQISYKSLLYKLKQIGLHESENEAN